MHIRIYVTLLNICINLMYTNALLSLDSVGLRNSCETLQKADLFSTEPWALCTQTASDDIGALLVKNGGLGSIIL